jgi:hypothetical protein
MIAVANEMEESLLLVTFSSFTEKISERRYFGGDNTQ